VNKKVIFSEKTGEEHSVPVFIGCFSNEMVDVLVTVRMPYVSKLSSMGSQSHPETCLLIVCVFELSSERYG
jgi:hypothetical protein